MIILLTKYLEESGTKNQIFRTSAKIRFIASLRALMGGSLKSIVPKNTVVKKEPSQENYHSEHLSMIVQKLYKNGVVLAT